MIVYFLRFFEIRVLNFYYDDFNNFKLFYYDYYLMLIMFFLISILKYDKSFMNV